MTDEAIKEDEKEKEEQKIKLPEHNPVKKCPRCGAELPMLEIRKGIFDDKPYIANNFCPASASKGEIIYLCMKCKVVDNASRRGGAKWS